MSKRTFYWPEEVKEEQKLYYLIKLINRKRTGSFYESSQVFTGSVLRSAEIYREEIKRLDLQSRGVIPHEFRYLYDLPENYEERTKDAKPPKLPENLDDFYLCSVREIAYIPAPDPMLKTLRPTYGDDPLVTYLESATKSFGHWLAAAKQAKEMGKAQPPKPKGRIPEDLAEEIKEFTLDEVPAISKFDQWKLDWEAGKTTTPWRGRAPKDAVFPDGYKSVKEQIQELAESLSGDVDDPESELIKIKAAIIKKST